MSSAPHAERPPLAQLAGAVAFAALALLLVPQARLRLPFEVCPGGAYIALLGLPALWRHGLETDWGADVQVAAYGGTNHTMRSRLHLVQPGGTDLRFGDIAWEGEPFRAPPYYGLRAIYWLPGQRLGIMGDFTHIKARAMRGNAVTQTGQRDGLAVPPQQPLSATFKRLEFTHGYNLLTLNLVRRGEVGRARLIPYAGAGLGLAYPHVEVQRSGAPDATRTYAYQIAGPALQLLGGFEWRFGRRLSVFIEYKLDCAAINGELVGGGHVDTTLCTHQLLAGPAFHLRSLAAAPAP
jgi:lipid A oxidase